MIKTEELFTRGNGPADDYLFTFEYPWQALSGIKQFITEQISRLDRNEYDEIKPDVFAHKTAVIYPTAYINGPCIIGANTEVRQCAFIRGSAIIGKNCVIGNSTELKNVIICDNVQVPHYNYVGDSILGFKSHMGAGAVTSNVKSDKTLVTVNNNGERIETGLKKFGAILGENVEVGCNSVLNPGTIVCPRSNIYPLSCVRGTVPPDSILKTGNITVAKINKE
ncbi:MAG: UDP-N-acetylglucosamine pyrophosphorylase [Clostridia bacterium]|nr:UDP-N-acetylglucosamine pyrophosphorylase [Clostridia bacterium]